MRKAKFSVGGDGRTIKYSFKAQRLNEPAFAAGTGSATIQVGRTASPTRPTPARWRAAPRPVAEWPGGGCGPTTGGDRPGCHPRTAPGTRPVGIRGRRAVRRPCERDRGRELPSGRPAGESGRRRRRRRQTSRVSPPTSASIAAARSSSRSTPTPPTTASTSTAWATTAASARARSRRCTPSAALPQNQPACLTDAGDRPGRLRQLGGVGVLGGAGERGVGHLLRQAGARGRAPAREPHRLHRAQRTRQRSTLLFQTSDTTWQAYNQYGGNSLYVGVARRPRLQGELQPAVHTRGTDARGLGLQRRVPDGPLARGNGYDVSYTTGVDTDRRGAELLEHQVFLSVGHDEYWSSEQRANVEAARDAGVHLAFFSGNEVFWKTRWETSIDGSGTPYRTLVTYKETHANAKIDPLARRLDGHLARSALQPARRRRPSRERADRDDLHRQLLQRTPITVPAADGKMRFWRNTSVATLGAGADGDAGPTRRWATSGTRTSTTASVPPGWSGSRPRPLNVAAAPSRLRIELRAGHGDASSHAASATRAARWCSAPARCSGRGGSTTRTTAAATRPTSACSRRRSTCSPTWASQPATLQAGLVAATASTDTTRRPRRSPLRRMASTARAARPPRSPARRPTAAAASVGGVEVSVDGGATWHPASGPRHVELRVDCPVQNRSGHDARSRAVDDSGNLGAARRRRGHRRPHGCRAVCRPERRSRRPDPRDHARGNPFGRYYAEILRAEGLNEFAVADIPTVSAATLEAYDVVLLGFDAAQRGAGDDADDWVTGGGNLIAMRPDAQLAALLGLTPPARHWRTPTCSSNTASRPGRRHRRSDDPVPRHRRSLHARRRGGGGDALLEPATATANPAVTLRHVGTNGGAGGGLHLRSRALGRLHTPGQSRLGGTGTRRRVADPLRRPVLRRRAGDPQPDWVDLDKVAIPQADEQQRLLANLILRHQRSKPLPRFWYFPRGRRRAVVMTGDDHGNGGTRGPLRRLPRREPAGLLGRRLGVRPQRRRMSFPARRSGRREAAGVHGARASRSACTSTPTATTGRRRRSTRSSTASSRAVRGPVPELAAAGRRNRTHCIAWSDWATPAAGRADARHPARHQLLLLAPDWVQNRPGLFTGSGMPMRFADGDGTLIDVYQAARR